MNNLFSIFDSSTNFWFEMNWISSISSLFTFPLSYWFLSSRFLSFFKISMLMIYNEFKIILNNKFNSPNIILFLALMLMIFMNNFMGLFPYIFTSSSHLIFAMTFSFPIWLTLMIFSSSNNYNFMFSHMIPQSTPLILTPFMVLIESISNLIPPMTLAIRLCANMIAGHLLLTLLSQNCEPLNILIFIILLALQIILLSLEFSVSFIQSYVFAILSTLYSKETNYE